MHIILLLLGVWITGGAREIHAAPAAPTLADYRATYEREQVKIRTNNAPVLAADGEYLKTLEGLAADAKIQGDFDNTIALTAERKRFDATRMVPDAPTNLPPAIVKAQADYRAALARAAVERDQQIVKLNASYVRALKALIKVCLADDNMTEAEAVNKEMKHAEAEMKFAEATLAATPAGDTPTGTTAASDPPPKGVTKAAMTANFRKRLVLYYNFDKNEGDQVPDQSPEQNTGTVHGAKWTAQGKVGGAYTFDGSGDYINLPKGGLISGGSFSVFAWIKPVELERLMVVYVQGRGSYISMRVDTRGKLGGSADGHNVDRSATTLSADTWYHVGMVYDGNHNAVYVNGVQKTRNARTADYTRDIAHIGAGDQNGSPEYYFSGSMDEVMIWNRALTDAEIKQIYNSQQ